MQESNNYSLYVKTYPEDIVLNAVCTLLHFPPNYLGRYYQLHFTSKEIGVQEEYTIYKKNLSACVMAQIHASLILKLPIMLRSVKT